MFLSLILAAAAGDTPECAPVNLWKKVPELAVLSDPAAVNAGIADAEARLKCSAYVDPTRLARLHLVGAISGGETAREHLVRVFTLFPDEVVGQEEKDQIGSALVDEAREAARAAGSVELRAKAPIRVDGIPLVAGERRTFGPGAHILQWDVGNEVRGSWHTFEPSTRWAAAPESVVQLPGRPGAERRLGVALGVSGAALTLASATTLIVSGHILSDNALSIDDDLNRDLSWMQGIGIGGTLAGTALMLVPVLSGTFK